MKLFTGQLLISPEFHSTDMSFSLNLTFTLNVYLQTAKLHVHILSRDRPKLQSPKLLPEDDFVLEFHFLKYLYKFHI